LYEAIRKEHHPIAVTTTSAPALAVASNAQARRIAAAKEARDLAGAELEQQRARRVDTTTPLVNGTMMPTEQLPDPPAHVEEEQPILDARAITLRTQILYRGRAIWIEARGLTLDRFCDMLDQRLGVAQ
jgi:hypothetical protein